MIELVSDNDSVPSNENRLRLFNNGQFMRLRGQIGHRNTADEIHFVLNNIMSIHRGQGETASVELAADPLAQRYLASVPTSPEYYQTLFEILRKVGFGTEARPAIQKYFEEIKLENEKSPLDGLLGGAEQEDERAQRSWLEQQNAAAALDIVFPEDK